MMNDHIVEFLPAACAGFGLLLAGAANLLLRARRLRVRITATLAAVTVSVVCAASLEVPGTVAATGRLLALGMLLFCLLASRMAVTGISAFLACLHRPTVRYAVLAAGGVGLLVGAGVKFESADKAAMDASMLELEWMDRASMTPSKNASATTDQGSQIVLKEPSTLRDGIDWNGAEERMLRGSRLDGQVIRRGGATELANCHGWVFTGGKFNLSADAVELILKENGYHETFEPQPGDLAIYRQAGGISHTAIVRYVTEGQPVIVEGKWGALGLFLHPADKCTYGPDYSFYRSGRNGHLLAGLGGSAPTPQPPQAATE